MAYNENKTRTWSRATANDGLYWESEFQRLYDNFIAIVNNGGSAPTKDMEALNTEIEILKGVKTVVFADSPYTIADNEEYGVYFIDTSGGDVDIILPTLSANINKKFIFKVIDATNLATIDGEGGEDIEGLLTVELPKKGDMLEVIGQASEWEILNENITCQLLLYEYAGYGSTDNKIIRFTTIGTNYGNLFTENHISGYAGNTEGLEITILKAGKYSCIGQMHKVGGPIGISLNSSQLTTSIDAITEVDKITQVHVPANGRSGGSVTRYFDVGDIVRAHSDGVAATANVAMFSISYIGS